MRSYNGGIVWHKIGEGKTRIGLSSFLQFNSDENEGELLVICSPKAIRQWKEEIEISPYANWLARTRFLSYGSLSRTWAGAAEEIDAMFATYPISLVIVDELWLYKNPATIRAKALRRIQGIGVPMIGLSGSLMTARRIEDIYGQAKSIGVGHLVARSLTHFHSQFCNAVKEFKGLSYWPKRNAIQIIQKRLAPVCDIYFPPKVREVRIRHVSIDPSLAQRRAINQLMEDYYTDFGEQTIFDPKQKGKLTRVKSSPMEIKHATTLLIKLQQISDGVLKYGKGSEIHIESNKFDRLLEMLQEYRDAGETPIVWFGFTASLERVRKALGNKAAVLSSKHAFDADGFRRGKYWCALATIGSGASLNDFKNCQYSIIYSTTFNALSLHQAMGRTDRKGSLHTVANYQFLSTSLSPDKEIYTSLLASNQIEATAIRTSQTVLENWRLRTAGGLDE